VIRLRALAGEALASAIAQPVASALTLLMVAGMVVAVMLTTGRTVGAEQRVLSSIDAAGTRSITIRAEDAAGLTSEVLDRLAGVDGIEWAGAFSSASDATNSAVPDGVRVAVRYAYGAQLERLGIPERSPAPGRLAYASAAALTQLGLPDAAGSVTLRSGASFGIGGALRTPDFLAAFEPLVLVPRDEASGVEPVNLLVVIARSPELVAPVAEAVVSVLAADDPGKVTMRTSEALAELRGLVQGQLGSFSRGLVLAVLALTAALVAVLLSGLVMMRRKDFGRRRALGASRGLIVALLLVQTAQLAVAGVVAGLIAACSVLLLSGDPVPRAEFSAALGVLAVAAATAAAAPPAVLASRRDPVRELRVP